MIYKRLISPPIEQSDKASLSDDMPKTGTEEGGNHLSCLLLMLAATYIEQNMREYPSGTPCQVYFCESNTDRGVDKNHMEKTESFVIFIH